MNYALITPARNEEKSIKRTIESVVAQKKLPVKWVIVSDASEDRTDEIVKELIGQYNFIQFIRKVNRSETGFASKVSAFNLGLQQLKNVGYDYIGNLDADIILDPDYYEAIIKEFAGNPMLGIAGGRVYEMIGNTRHNRKSSNTSVAGAVQLFRRECFEKIGGYMPLVYGGIDSAAEMTARSRGWEVKTLMSQPVLHIGAVLTGSGPSLKRKFYQGITHYQLGYNPLFEIVRQFYRITERPILSSLGRIAGFLWAAMRKKEKMLPPDTLKYFRFEQNARLRKINPFRVK